jgi:hypothetical protein
LASEVDELGPWESLVKWFERFVVYLGTKRALIDGLKRESTTFRACRDALYETAEPLLDHAQRSGGVRGHRHRRSDAPRARPRWRLLPR